LFIDTVGYSKLSMNEQRVAIDHRFQKLVAKAIVPEGEIIDVFSAAGLKQTYISVLSAQFPQQPDRSFCSVPTRLDQLAKMFC